MKNELVDIRYELSNIDDELDWIKDFLEEIHDELHIQNVINAQRNEILKELLYQNENGSRVLKVDTKLINQKLGEELLKL